MKLTAPSVAGTESGSFEYRKDVDGLRAVAVLLVMLFHAEVFGITGGYVGVDVFFVISGYLITQKILEQARQQRFTFAGFYVRRIRRLFPAMFSTILATLICGALILGPDALERLAISATTSVLSTANIQFYLEAGYWDTDSWSKPLLHMWSLSVEEQFYLVWPFVVLLLAAVAPRRGVMILIALTVTSLLITGLTTPESPALTFYMMPFRTYEFATGAICVFLTESSRRPGPRLQTAMVVAGLALIVWSALRFDAETPFPGWSAFIPSIGTALVIAARNPAAASTVLANPLATYLGRTSYSLYLVHWPVLVFARALGVELTVPAALGCMALTMALASLQYHLVETPLRRPRSARPVDAAGSFPRVALGAATGALVICLGALTVLSNDGFPQRFAEEFQQIASLSRSDVQRSRMRLSNELCRTKTGVLCGEPASDQPNFLILGDSHGPDGMNIMHAALPQANYLLTYHGGCPPVFELSGITHGFRDCPEFNQQRFEDISELAGRIDAAVFSMRISPERVDALVQMIDWFAQRRIQPIVLGAGPQYQEDLVPLIIQHGSLSNLNDAMAKFEETDHYEADAALERVVQAAGGIYLEKRPFFCPRQPCPVLLDGQHPLMFDRHHLSLQAATAYGESVRSRLRSAMASAGTKQSPTMSSRREATGG